MGKPRPIDCNPDRWPLLLGHRDTDGGEVHCSSRPGPRLVEGLVSLSEGSGDLHRIVSSLFPGPSSLPSLGPVGELERRGTISCRAPEPSLRPSIAMAQALRSSEPLPHPCLCNPLAVAGWLVTVYETWSPRLGSLRKWRASWIGCLSPLEMTEQDTGTWP